MQLLAHQLGGTVASGTVREYGHSVIFQNGKDESIFKGLNNQIPVWMSHGDQVDHLESDFEVLATTATCPMAAVTHSKNKFYGVQFHPEVTHTPHGVDLLRNFLYEICDIQGTWKMSDFMEVQCELIREQVGEDRVLCGLSGGGDSSVVAALLHKAIGDQLICVFVDNGLLRKNEREYVETTFRDHFEIDLTVVDASREFLQALEGVVDPQEKRTIIGHRFIDVFKETAEKIQQDSNHPIQYLKEQQYFLSLQLIFYHFLSLFLLNQCQ